MKLFFFVSIICSAFFLGAVNLLNNKQPTIIVLLGLTRYASCVGDPTNPAVSSARNSGTVELEHVADGRVPQAFPAPVPRYLLGNPAAESVSNASALARLNVSLATAPSNSPLVRALLPPRVPRMAALDHLQQEIANTACVAESERTSKVIHSLLPQKTALQREIDSLYLRLDSCVRNDPNWNAASQKSFNRHIRRAIWDECDVTCYNTGPVKANAISIGGGRSKEVFPCSIKGKEQGFKTFASHFSPKYSEEEVRGFYKAALEKTVVALEDAIKEGVTAARIIKGSYWVHCHTSSIALEILGNAALVMDEDGKPEASRDSVSKVRKIHEGTSPQVPQSVVENSQFSSVSAETPQEELESVVLEGFKSGWV